MSARVTGVTYRKRDADHGYDVVPRGADGPVLVVLSDGYGHWHAGPPESNPCRVLERVMRGERPPFGWASASTRGAAVKHALSLLAGLPQGSQGVAR